MRGLRLAAPGVRVAEKVELPGGAAPMRGLRRKAEANAAAAAENLPGGAAPMRGLRPLAPPLAGCDHVNSREGRPR